MRFRAEARDFIKTELAKKKKKKNNCIGAQRSKMPGIETVGHQI